MSKKLSFKGTLDEGLVEKIKLSTLNGKRGYRITKFQTMITTPGVGGDYEAVVKIYSTKQTSGSTTVDFTEGDLLAVDYTSGKDSPNYGIDPSIIIFDNEVVNQDIFVTYGAPTGTLPVNYYIELETVTLTDLQTTQLTLKNLRQIASR